MTGYRPPIVYGEAHVASTRQVAAHVRRVELVGEVLDDYRPDRPAEAFRLMLPPTGHDRVDFPHAGPDGLPAWRPDQARPSLRGHTVRYAEPGAVWFDVVERGDGTWPALLREGDLVGVADMRHGYSGSDAAVAVLVGDRSAIPALAAVVDGAASTRCHVVVEGPVADDELTLLGPRADVEHTDDADGTAAALAGLTSAAPQHLYVAGEVRIARTADTWAARSWGLPPSRRQSVVYWERGLTTDERDSLVYERYAQAARQGRDVSDPLLVGELELEPFLVP